MSAADLKERVAFLARALLRYSDTYHLGEYGDVLEVFVKALAWTPSQRRAIWRELGMEVRK